ncbi:hypothetical protein OSTOST_07420 [Ostertagia ostertagi]
MEQNRRRGRPRVYANESERLRMRRQRETEQERTVRLETEYSRQHQRRQNENVEDRERQQQRRDSEGVDQRAARMEVNAQRQRRRRQSESIGERQVRMEMNAQRQRRRRQSESIGERQVRMEMNAQRQRGRRESEGIRERQVRMEANATRQQRRRQLETAEERDARLQSNAQTQQRRRASDSAEERASRSQVEAERLQRRREVESSGARAARLREDAERHQRRRTQETEHERSIRLQANASANRRRRNRPPSTTGAALHTRIAEKHYLGELNQRCVDCGALHFLSEVKANHPGKFRECCDLGRFTLNFFESFPEELRVLFVRGPEPSEEVRRVWKNFHENIRSFNSALAMASMGAQVDALQGRGPYCYRIHGQIYHRLGPLHPRVGEPRQYGQIYILDTELAAQQRLGNARNIIYVGEDNDVPANRSLAVHLRGTAEDQLINIRDIDKICDPLTYPLLFPTGAGGWEPGLRNREGARISQREYYAYLFSIRDTFNPILYAGKLCQQFAVDAYVKIEQNRLNFHRRNQLILRRDTYRGLQDYLAGDDNFGPPGNRVVLSSSHLGSPRGMQQAYQDAMAIVARYGRPTYFLTMTCNPQWRELRENLFPGQSTSDRPDLVARVFNAKLQELCKDLFKKHVLGEVEAYVYVIEFQKRGLPHCHMLLIMKDDWRVRTAEEVDKSVCAEIPNREAEPELYAAVTSYMIHRKCGAVDPRSPCMQNGSCSKRFPKQIRERTTLDVDGYPNYRRRNLSPTEINGIPYGDEWVVPTNPYLLLKYDCHINVEICGMISAVKYLYKYIYKGPDRAHISIENEPAVGDNQAIDEIKQHLNTRYVCAPQSMYRIFGYTIQDKSHTVCRLAVHLPELQTVRFVQGQEQQYLEQAGRKFHNSDSIFRVEQAMQ